MAKDYYYKKKTKDYFEKLGYSVEYLEKMHRIYDRNKNKVLFVKKDLFNSDLLAMNEKEIIFIQLKSNKAHVSEGIKAYKKMKRPINESIKFWVVYWEKGKPVFVDVNEVVDK